MSRLEIDGSLFSWNDLRTRFSEQSILIGNGASCAIWPKFQYASLFEKAAAGGAITEVDIRIFDGLRTTNFENVLSNLITTSVLLTAMGKDTSEIHERYECIKDALVHSIREVHIPWVRAQSTFSPVYRALSEYRTIYSTNYDLIIYWSIIEGGDPSRFKDFFWPSGNVFDLVDTSVSPGSIRVFYLHGGLHLESLPNGYTHKRINDGRTLLDQFGAPSTEGAFPLVVTEGTSEQKMVSVQNSPYLSFAYQSFALDEAALVVVGHSLGDSDSHLVEALKKNPRSLAISIRADSEEEVIRNKVYYYAKFPESTLYFFSATTHPLCSPRLRVAE